MQACNEQINWEEPLGDVAAQLVRICGFAKVGVRLCNLLAVLI